MIEIKISDIIDEVMHHLGYIAGKRSETAAEYFRHSACEADKGMLKRLAEEAAVWLVSASGGLFKIGVAEGKLTFSFRNEPEEDIEPILVTLFVHKVLCSWFSLFGMDGNLALEEAVNVLLGYVSDVAGRKGKPRCRPISRF